MNVLIVDDNRDSLYILESLFRGDGWEVYIAEDGIAALDIVRTEPVGVIVSDVLMPRMDGFQLCRSVKTDNHLRHIPFIVYTATYTSPQDEAYATKLGAERFIRKPSDPEEFLAEVHAVVKEAESGMHRSADAPLMDEGESLRLYSERLAERLQLKIDQAERELQARRAAERQLHESEKLFRSLMENVEDLVYAGSSDGIFTYVSPNWKEHLGIEPDEIIGQPFSVFEPYLHPDDADNCRAIIPAVFEREESYLSAEYRVRYADGSWRWHVSNAAPLKDRDGRGYGLVGVARDMTERKELEQQLMQAQKLESIGRLAGGVAHDYNNMLGVILGSAELALKNVTPEDPVHAKLEQIRSAARRSADITRQLLAFARKQTVAPKVIDLNESLEGMLKMLHRLIGEEIDLSWRPGTNLDSVEIDPVQLDQLLANLCVNASDAIGGNGKITIETANTEFDTAYCNRHQGFKPGHYVMLAVSDNGCGMDKETQDHIYEPFFTTKETGRGTGLGLATVYGIVKQNRGFINLYSEPGSGTTFRIYLPRHTQGAEAESNTQQSPALSSGHGQQILVVEDEPAMLELTSMMLEELLYEPIPAGTPAAALELARENPEITLLITDVVMPGMNGRELAQQLRQQHPQLQNLNVLYMSGYTANGIAHHGVLGKGVHFIQKPFSLQELAQKMEDIL